MTLIETERVHFLPIANVALVETLRGVIGDDFPFLVNTFIEDSAKKIHRLQRLDVYSQRDTIKQLIHSFKGSCCNMGAERLAFECEHLEAALSEMTAFDFAARIIKIDLCFQEFVTQLKEF